MFGEFLRAVLLTRYILSDLHPNPHPHSASKEVASLHPCAWHEYQGNHGYPSKMQLKKSQDQLQV